MNVTAADAPRRIPSEIVSSKSEIQNGGLMNDTWNSILWGQFGAAIDMLERAILACPEALWSDRSREPEFWYMAYHALFFLDYYLSESVEDFMPPAPFTLDELSEDGILPDRAYTKAELLAYLEHGREKCRPVLAALPEAALQQRCAFDWLDLSVAEMHLYNLRHVQHHAAQLNTLLRVHGAAAPGWVRKAR